MSVRSDLTEIIAVLDRSGSMHDAIDDAIGGFNSMIEHQKSLPGECRLTLVIFDNVIEFICENAALIEAPVLSKEKFFARDTTALADALGEAIDRVGARYGSIPEERRPGKVVVFVNTDGMENASKRYTTARVREMVKHQREKYGWQFVFAGADIDAYEGGANLGVLRGCAVNYGKSPVGTEALYAAIGSNVASFRSGTSNSMDFTPEQKADIEQHATPDPNLGLPGVP